jgi:hypothetical protein
MPAGKFSHVSIDQVEAGGHDDVYAHEHDHQLGVGTQGPGPGESHKEKKHERCQKC